MVLGGIIFHSLRGCLVEAPHVAVDGSQVTRVLHGAHHGSGAPVLAAVIASGVQGGRHSGSQCVKGSVALTGVSNDAVYRGCCFSVKWMKAFVQVT